MELFEEPILPEQSDTCSQVSSLESSSSELSWNPSFAPHGTEHDSGAVALMQKSASWRESVAAHAHQRLPPPGNGPKRHRQVCFSSEVDVESQVIIDTRIESEFVNGLWDSLQEELQQEQPNPFIQAFGESDLRRSFEGDPSHQIHVSQDGARRVFLRRESSGTSPSSGEKWTDRFRNRQYELGIDEAPAFLQAPQS